MNDKIRRLLDEWDAEVRENGIWTSGHSIAARMAAILRSVGPSLVEQKRQEEQAKWAEAVRTFRSTNAYRHACASVVSAPARHRYEPDVYVGSPCKVCRLEPTHHSHAVVSAPPKKRHDRSCPAYGNYQPPYEECNCGYESANE